MQNKAFNFYIRSFRGLSREIWLLAFATLINRAGTMVVPFIALYLSGELGFSLTQVGWVMTWFGAGSLIGSWIGGKLSDKISYYKIMVTSLMLTGLSFMVLFEFKSYEYFCTAIFFLMIIADSFRPAAFSAINAYSKSENRVRSISLIRMAINLGFSIGPALGGMLIYNFGYQYLFYIDGFTCIMASLLMIFLLSPKKVNRRPIEPEVVNKSESKYISVWQDRPYLLLIGVVFLIDIVFVQLFANVPLFYREIHGLNEKTIGYLMALNGIIIFVFEMPLVSYLEFGKKNKLLILFTSSILIAASYFVFNLGVFFSILVISMILITIGEMLGFPFSNSFAIDRAPKKKLGEYMGLYTVAFSASHIIGPNLGIRISDLYGFSTSWTVMGIISLIAAGLCLWLNTIIQKEQMD